MSNEKESPERRRERIRQEEIKRNPAGNLDDAFNRSQHGNLVDLVGSLGWKFTGIILLIVTIIIIIIFK